MPVLGVWMWPETIEKSGAGEALRRCVKIGVTDIFFLAKGLSGLVSFRSRIAPRGQERDLLGELLSAAHKKGVRVHAWFTSANDEHYKALHPESGRCHYVRGKDKGLISLTDEGYVSYMRGVLGEAARNYDIDGLHLDYIRYNHLTYGWDEKDVKRYAAAGADLEHLHALLDRTFLRGEKNEENCIFDALRASDESVRALARVRREDVRRFARELILPVRAERKEIAVSAALMPEGAYDDTAFADLHYGQSYEDVAALYDFALPMAYSQAYGKDGGWVRRVAEGAWKRKVRTVMGLHAFEGGTGKTLLEDISALKEAPTEGICLFRAGAFVMAWNDGGRLRLYNPLEASVTAVLADGEPLPLRAPLEPGEESCVPLSASPKEIRAFAADKEVCAYLAGTDGLTRTENESMNRLE